MTSGARPPARASTGPIGSPITPRAARSTEVRLAPARGARADFQDQGADCQDEDVRGLVIDVEAEPVASDLEAVEAGLVASNAARTGTQAEQARRPLAAFARRDDTGVGGAVGTTGWGWLYVSRLWVAAPRSFLCKRWRAPSEDAGESAPTPAPLAEPTGS
jgi:hypothetical protein